MGNGRKPPPQSQALPKGRRVGIRRPLPVERATKDACRGHPGHSRCSGRGWLHVLLRGVVVEGAAQTAGLLQSGDRAARCGMAGLVCSTFRRQRDASHAGCGPACVHRQSRLMGPVERFAFVRLARIRPVPFRARNGVLRLAQRGRVKRSGPRPRTHWSAGQASGGHLLQLPQERNSLMVRCPGPSSPLNRSVVRLQCLR